MQPCPSGPRGATSGLEPPWDSRLRHGYPCGRSAPAEKAPLLFEKTPICLQVDAVALAGRVFHSYETRKDRNAVVNPSRGTLMVQFSPFCKNKHPLSVLLL